MNKKIIAAVVFFILAGCNIQNNAANNKQNLINVKNSNIQDVDRKTGQQISKHLVELATSVPNVHDATAVVLGKYAIVGIDVNSKLDRSQVSSIKYSVAESLKKDPYGEQAVVVADPDTAERLKEIAAEIRQGRPGQGIMNELADVSGRLMPEVPGDLITPSPKKTAKQQKQQLPAKEERNLDNKQHQESNRQ